MRIVRYKARTMQDALQQVRSDLGADAIILNTRTLPPRFRWLGRTYVEVVAAVSTQPPAVPLPEGEAPAEPVRLGMARQEPRPHGYGSGGASPSGNGGTAGHGSAGASPSGNGGTAGHGLAGASPSGNGSSAGYGSAGASPSGSGSRPAQADVADLQRQIREIRDTLGRLMVWTAPKDELVEALVARLIDSGMSRELARELVAGAGGQPADAVWGAIQAAAAARIRVSGPIRVPGRPTRKTEASGPDQGVSVPDDATVSGEPRRDGPLVVALVGPTGVGKTTTIAKLAARYAIGERKRVALVTLDTYRVAAVDQIRTYAQMLDVPLEVVVSPEDAVPVMERVRDRELVLVDTIGHGPNDEMQLGQLRMLLTGVCPDQVHLTLAAPTDRRAMLNAVERFSRLQPTHLLFTKVDEAVVLGATVETAIRCEWPVSYVSYGQDVPEKIAPADAAQLSASLCLEEP